MKKEENIEEMKNGMLGNREWMIKEIKKKDVDMGRIGKKEKNLMSDRWKNGKGEIGKRGIKVGEME